MRKLNHMTLVVGVAVGGCSVSDSDEGETLPDAQLWELSPADVCPDGFANALEPGAVENFPVADQQRRFLLKTPDPEQYAGPRPLLMYFHGSGGDLLGDTAESGFDKSQLQDFVDAGFVVVSLHTALNGSIWRFWDDIRDADDLDRENKDLAYFDAVSSCVGAHHAIDRNRIYVAGMSAGASMTNVVLQNRSELLAGGIVSSGLFDLTQPKDPAPLDEMFVIVSWTGEEDISYPDGSELHWYEQASIASLFYAEDPLAESVAQFNCHADPSVPHSWMTGMNAWYIEELLRRPKGQPRADGSVLPPGPPGFTCESSPYRFSPDVAVECADADPVACTDFCQLVAECTVVNVTVGPVVEEQVRAIGFSGDGNKDCTGCTTMCEQTELTAADMETLECITVGQGIECSSGVEGFQPFADGIDTCCAGRDDSPFCMNLCSIMLTNDLAPTFFPSCVELVGT